ncbi:holo-ACP synthase [Phormidium sp. LEGE 05292]|uniref:holo-ACP synthase n=1 Tax=[Phormidium] sp. LEGE 05292 TaxID=767427 RepID=UPI001882FADE|nr:holo-ACP synthase [Phormidium sp. LEGE 05292]MBE9224509.1 holo-ACP synthase [Phormidium sp. LEGE 05292]
MSIIGHGIDIVDVRSIEALVKQKEEGFAKQYLTVAERNVSGFNTNHWQYLASRLAAKKAVLKVLCRDYQQSDLWLEIEIQKRSTGEPYVVLYATALQIATKFGITKWLLSISHTPFYAAASAIAFSTTNKCQLHAHPPQ